VVVQSEIVVTPAAGDGVALVTLNLPDRRNAMTEGMTSAWRNAMTELARDRSVRCLVVTGAGTAFCAGGDLAWLQTSPQDTIEDVRRRMAEFYRSWLSVRSLGIPVVAAVNGAAIGAGLALALACDVRIAADDARLAVPFTALGLHPGMATAWLLRDVAGAAVARDLLLTGRTLSAPQAREVGLVSQVVPSAQLRPHALSVAQDIARAAPLATRLTTEALRSIPDSIEDALRWDELAQSVTMLSEDLDEGLAAARERRQPRFGRR
jgi:enoyl-CoA hydratase/carnithine racemase